MQCRRPFHARQLNTPRPAPKPLYWRVFEHMRAQSRITKIGFEMVL